jgi:hypothetical protein
MFNILILFPVWMNPYRIFILFQLLLLIKFTNDITNSSFNKKDNILTTGFTSY